jgi:hypothetical protein
MLHLKPAQAKLVRPYLKNSNTDKRAGGEVQVVESLLRMWEALAQFPALKEKKRVNLWSQELEMSQSEGLPGKGEGEHVGMAVGGASWEMVAFLLRPGCRRRWQPCEH